MFFCYGRLSNRQLLQRYGFAMEHNKYDKLFVRVFIGKYLEEYPDYAELVQVNGMPVFKRVKLSRSKFCEDLVVIHRAMAWKEHRQRLTSLFAPEDLDAELGCLELALEQVAHEQSRLPQDLAALRQGLQEQCSYHEYFTRVFRLGRVEILLLQRQLLEHCQRVIRRVLERQPMALAVGDLPPQHLRMLRGYLNTVRKI
jgi:hypothetical protein